MEKHSLAARLRLVVIAERSLAARPLVAVVREALEAGAPCIQLRNKGDSASALFETGLELRTLTHRHGALLIVNDRLDVALAVGADGVHVGPDDVPVAAVRWAAPRGFLVGHSTDDPELARRAVAEGADYLGCGTVYATTTKKDAGAVIGVEGLRRVVGAVGVPVVGIGGITAARARDVAKSGAAGVAAVGGVMATADVAGAVREYLSAFDD